MPRIRFEDLLQAYRITQFGNGGTEDVSYLTIDSQAISNLLTRLETDDDAAADAGITLLDDFTGAIEGVRVKIRVGSPRTGLGVLARTMDGLLAAPGARIEEPKRYYLVDPPFSPGDAVEPDPIKQYKKVLALVRLFADVASFLDATRANLVFVKEGRMVVPIRFDAADLSNLVVADAERLLSQFVDDLHKDQKHEILFEAMVDLCRAQPIETRFEFALRNVGHLANAVREGYRLFASSFSYSKVRSEIEDARIDYTGKIHKTIVDVQNQLLGIPIATVVVASQMKAPTACGIESWVNLAVLIGAWIFILLLLMAIVNQWLTLSVIKGEVSRQKTKLLSDFPAVSNEFVDIFDSLSYRVWWHRAGLLFVALVGLAGATVATHFYGKIAAIPVPACVASASGNGLGSASLPPPQAAPMPASVPAPVQAPSNNNSQAQAPAPAVHRMPTQQSPTAR